eukprot:1159394-Pelagomonas_calceolata.AAC.18
MSQADSAWLKVGLPQQAQLRSGHLETAGITTSQARKGVCKIIGTYMHEQAPWVAFACLHNAAFSCTLKGSLNTREKKGLRQPKGAAAKH